MRGACALSADGSMKLASLLPIPLGLLWLVGRPCAARTAACEHDSIAIDPPERPEQAHGNYTKLLEGEPILNHLSLNKSKLYWYQNFNVTTMNQPDRYRKLIISLEPCEGIVYLFVRKTRECWPDPRSCCEPLPGTGQQLGNNTGPP